MLLLSVGVMVIAVGAVIVVVGASFAQRQPLDPRTAFLRVAAASGVMALGASVMYVVGTPQLDEIFANTAADAALVLSVGLMGIAVSMVCERRARAAAVLASVAGLVVAVSSELLPAEIARAVLMYALAVTCGACAVLAVRNDQLPVRPTRILAGAMAFYSLYSAARGIALTLYGPDSAHPGSPFGYVAALTVSVGVDLAITIAVTMMLVPATRAARRKSRSLTQVTVSDWELVARAYGPVRAGQLVEELQAATRDLDPHSVDIDRGVATSIGAATHALTGPLTYEYGWRPEEIALLVADGDVDEESPARPSRTLRSPGLKQGARPTPRVAGPSF